MSRFAISVLALDGIEMTVACVNSIIKHSTPGKYKLFLTNNGSKDGTRDYFDDLAKSNDFISVIHNEKNECFIDPNNLVFDKAKEAGFEFCILINNDITVPSGWLEKFEDVFATNPKAAIAGPKGTISCVSPVMLGNSRERFEFVEGSCFCAKISVLSTQGKLFSNYLKDIYYDDLDASLRMQRAGFTIHQADFQVSHRNGSTCARHPDAIARCRAANLRNQGVMLTRWAHWNRVRKFDFPILVKRSFATGDVLLATPIVKALKELWPLCPIDVETGSPDIFIGNPYVRRATNIPVNVTRDTMVVNLDGAYEKNATCHVLESYAKAAGLDPLVSPRLELFTTLEAPTPMKEKVWAAIHVGPTTWPAKNWPLERWSEVIKWLREKGWQVLLLGDRPKVGSVHLDFDLDRRGQKGNQELAAMLRECCLFIGLDSFPAHAAAAMEVPCVVLYGITNPDCFRVSTAPYIAVRSDPSHPDTGKRNRMINVTFVGARDDVMRTISVESVKAAVDEILK